MRCYGDNLQVTALALYVRDVDGDVVGIVTPSYGVIVQLENKIKVGLLFLHKHIPFGRSANCSL